MRALQKKRVLFCLNGKLTLAKNRASIIFYLYGYGSGCDMKLYSRGQVIFYTVCGFAVALILAMGFGIIKTPFSSASEDTVTEKSVESDFEFQTGNIIPIDNGSSLSGYSEEESTNIQIYESLNPAVVNITTETLALNWFMEPVPSDGGTGSGSIIDKRGYVLTNFHVVENAYKVTITLADSSQYSGEVIGKDPENDLAVVKFDPDGKELTTIPFGNSSLLRVGQKVLAIGNPFGYDRTLTDGIVSGLGRPVKTSKDMIIRDMIQTDASINPGNSGGPLLSTQGQMIGINTMIYSPSGGSVGIGFAVPVDTARRIVPDLIQFGMVRRGWIDVVPVQLDSNIVRYGDLHISKGVLISKISKDGNAAQAGLRGGDLQNPVRYGRSILYFGGDIIVEIDGMAVESIADLLGALEDNKPGETVTVVAFRGKTKKTFQVTLSERPEDFYWE